MVRVEHDAAPPPGSAFGRVRPPLKGRDRPRANVSASRTAIRGRLRPGMTALCRRQEPLRSRILNHAAGCWAGDAVAEVKMTRPAVLACAIGAVALSGWGAYAYSGRSAAALARELREQIQRTETERDALTAERMQLQQDLGAARDRLAAAIAEQSRTARARDQAKADAASAQQHLATLAKRAEKARAVQAPAPTPPAAPPRAGDRKARVAQAEFGPPLLPPARIPDRAKERVR